MAEISEVVKMIGQQVNAGELNFFGFRLVALNEHALRINKGRKNLDVILDYGQDVYTLEKHTAAKDRSVKTEKVGGIFCDQLADAIEAFFNYSYISKPRFG